MKRIKLAVPSGLAMILRKVFRTGVLAVMLISSLPAFFATYALGAIPDTERQVLLNIYNNTNGPSWTNKWTVEGTDPCTWYGVVCDANHVTKIMLQENSLDGSLPELGGLTDLQYFDVSNNQLTGSIPSLTGLTNLQYFYVNNNTLTGPIPALTGLTNLRDFLVYYNDLSGSIPSLAGLTNLHNFYASNNDLSGSIPSLTGLTNLRNFHASDNQLTGTIPSLSGLTELSEFGVGNNLLTGSIPSLTGLINLQVFFAYNNQLTGSIPSLAGLSMLSDFSVSYNGLTGEIPSLTGLTNLQFFDVSYNQLTGDVPAVPNPSKLSDGGSQLCPNKLNLIPDSAWDTATGSAPWYQDCTTYSVTYYGNGSEGGSVPVDGSRYLPDEGVTVLGNIGALYKTGYIFLNWNTDVGGSGTDFFAGDMFPMGAADMALYAQWTLATGQPVSVLETLYSYDNIQSAYDTTLSDHPDYLSLTIDAQSGLGNSSALHFDQPVSVRLSGGYDIDFYENTGATLVIGGIEIIKGSVEIGNIIIQ